MLLYLMPRNTRLMGVNCHLSDGKKADFLSVNSYTLTICFPLGRPPGLPQGNPREQYSICVSFFPAGEGSFLVLETTSLDNGDIPTGLVRVLISEISLLTEVFSGHFIMPICCGCS